jgi:hypothetical protein
LISDEDSGRLGITDSVGDAAAPIVQFLSKEGCFLCVVSWASSPSPATLPIKEAVLNSFAELCLE